jgi:predicted dehydrogenase/threonine dehydrogenase-like Zn-dependent dehydrogenase
MKQVLQNRKTGQVRVVDVPTPQLRSDGLLVRNVSSLISAGTERASIELSQKSLVGMARERPDLVQRVLDKLRKDGFLATMNAVREQFDRELPLGYSAAGIVTGLGTNVTGYEPGQLVACCGAGFACHAEMNAVPKLLAAAAPEKVTAEQAAYATVGSIALQGIRNTDARVGETIAVVGLGLIGQLAVMLLRASGCRVIGLDVSPKRVEQALTNGAVAAFAGEGPAIEEAVLKATRGRGCDAILITAATKSNAPVELAARIARDRAKVVMVGVTGMDIPRNDYYHKELTFIVSRSYGPGRYDSQFEEKGHDYPIGYVRWTEQRNLEAFLDLCALGAIKPETLTTHRFPIADAVQAYEMILEGKEPYLGVVLEYPTTDVPPASKIELRLTSTQNQEPRTKNQLGISFIGAGNFARGVLLKNLQKLPGIEYRGILTASGQSAVSAGNRYGFAFCTSEVDEILSDSATDAVFIATRHSQHADLVLRALKAGKAVFVEKPLAVNAEQFERMRQAVGGTGSGASMPATASPHTPSPTPGGRGEPEHPSGHPPITKNQEPGTKNLSASQPSTLNPQPPRLMVGFNRRFAPMAVTLKQHFAGVHPLHMVYRVNAGTIPAEHWLSDPAEGGRIVGEGCHFLDFFAYLTDASPVSVERYAVDRSSPDDVQLTVQYDDGSVGHLIYTTTGAKATSKERVEVFGGGRSGLLDDFRALELDTSSKRIVNQKSWFSQDKGHAAELAAFVDSVRTGALMPIPLESLLATTEASLVASGISLQSQDAPHSFE